MTSRKPLKSVVTSLAQSFTSLMNYSGDDYVLGHIVRAAWSTGATRLRVDLLRGAIDPSPLLLPEVRSAVAYYAEWFPDLVRRSNSSIDFVSAAELLVSVDPTTRRPYLDGEFQESPFICTVHVIDDHGKAYSHEIKGWWYPEKTEAKKKWWKFW